MQLDRRHFLATAVAGGTALAAAPVLSAPLSKFGLDAGSFGVRPGSPDDQTAVLQLAIDKAAQTRTPLMLAPGVYRAGELMLPAGANIAGVRGATRLVLTSGNALLLAHDANTISLTGLTLDGGGQPLPKSSGLVKMKLSHDLRITDCVVMRAGGIGIALERCDGAVTNTTITDAADTALFSLDGFGLTIANNIIRNAGNGGIRVWQTENRDDSSSILDNKIENIKAVGGGDGPNGNAINVYLAANVIVRGNHIRTTAFSAVRGNTAFNIQIVGNNCAALGEVAIYSEFGFEGAIISNNFVDGAAIGVSVTNYNDGGRIATVSGNIIRNLVPRPKTPTGDEGIGITVEADSAVTGNVIESATNAGINVGFGKFLRDVAVTGNVVRTCGYGVAVSVTPGAGDAVITGNMISGARNGAIVGTNHRRVVTGDLAKTGAGLYPQLTIEGNKVR